MRNFRRSLFYNYEAFPALSGFYRKYHALFSALDLANFKAIPTFEIEKPTTGENRIAKAVDAPAAAQYTPRVSGASRKRAGRSETNEETKVCRNPLAKRVITKRT